MYSTARNKCFSSKTIWGFFLNTLLNLLLKCQQKFCRFCWHFKFMCRVNKCAYNIKLKIVVENAQFIRLFLFLFWFNVSVTSQVINSILRRIEYTASSCAKILRENTYRYVKSWLVSQIQKYPKHPCIMIIFLDEFRQPRIFET